MTDLDIQRLLAALQNGRVALGDLLTTIDHFACAPEDAFTVATIRRRVAGIAASLDLDNILPS